jgi:hypothetical protein
MAGADYYAVSRCRFCDAYLVRMRGHWITDYHDEPLHTGQDFSRARTCDASPVMAKLHAPVGAS